MKRKASRSKRSYKSELRAAGADETRRAILDAARRLIVEQGYTALRMERIAADAGVALDTVYAAVGKKAALVRLLIETAISGTDAEVPPDERDYVRRIQASRSADEKLHTYARALALIQPRLAPLVAALQTAGGEHPELAELWREISQRRHRNMLRFADDLLATNELRSDSTREAIADALWTIGAPQLFLLLTAERGWSSQQYSEWIATAWRRMLLKPVARRRA